MKKPHLLMLGCMILATILGMKGQSIAYFLNRHIAPVPPVYHLTVITAASVLLFLVTPVWVYKLNINSEIKRYAMTVGVNFLISIPITLWSLFVLIMWWG